MSDASELMKAAHKRSRENMEKVPGCTLEGHASLIDGVVQTFSDSEIIYFALEELPNQVIKKLNGQAESLRKPPLQTSRKDETKIEYGKFKMTTHSVEVANAIIKVAGILIFVGMFVCGAKFLADLRHEIVTRVATIEAKVK